MEKCHSTIYTRRGDNGQTVLGDGSVVFKDHAQLEALGTLDEFTASLGCAKAWLKQIKENEKVQLIKGWLDHVQADLIKLGSQLFSAKIRNQSFLTVDSIKQLEQWIDCLDSERKQSRSFIIPGDNTPSAWLHFSRTICRRFERALVTVKQKERIDPLLLQYINRLSDLLFVMAEALD